MTPEAPIASYDARFVDVAKRGVLYGAAARGDFRHDDVYRRLLQHPDEESPSESPSGESPGESPGEPITFRIRPDWTPALTADSDNFTIGHRWSSTTPIVIRGAWYYRPAGIGEPTTLTALLYNLDGLTVHASGSISNPPEGWSFVPFASDYFAAANTDFVTAVQTDGLYGYDLSGLEEPIVDQTVGVVTIPANGASYEFGHQFPNNFWSGMHAADTGFEL